MGGLKQTATGWVETDTVERVGKRRTADESVVEFWNDGSVTLTRLGFMYGRPARTREGIIKAIEANRLLAGEVSMYGNDELKKAVRTARAAVKQKKLPPLIHFRRKMAGVNGKHKLKSQSEQRRELKKYMKKNYGV